VAYVDQIEVLRVELNSLSNGGIEDVAVIVGVDVTGCLPTLDG
jgi:hypothetical protein